MRKTAHAHDDDEPGYNARAEDSTIAAPSETDRLLSGGSADTAKSAQPKQNHIFVFLGLQIALFAAALEYSIVSTALPRIGSDLKAMGYSSWVASSYLVTQNAFNPVLVKLSDIFGRKNIILFSIGTFTVGSLFCGVAQSMISLIVARAFQGIGAAGIGPMIHIIIADIVPLHKRANYQALVDVCFTAATLAGPFIGGTLTDYVSWRGVFLVNIPVSLISMAMIYTNLNLPREPQDLKEQLKRIDYTGNLLVLCASVLFTLALSLGSQGHGWDSPLIITFFALTAVLIVALLYVEKYVATEPVIPLRLFSNRTVTALLLYRVGWGIAFSSYAYYLPLFFQIVRGDSAMWSGIRLIPVEFGSVSTTFLMGRVITHTGVYKPILIVGSGAFSSCFILFWFFDRYISWNYIYGTLVLEGMGMGGCVASNMIALQASVRHEDIAVASGLASYITILGANLGVAISSAILNSSLQQHLPSVMPWEYAQRIFDSPQYIYKGLPSQYFDAALDVYTLSFKTLWSVVATIACLAFVCSLFAKQYSLNRPTETKPAETNYQAVDVASDDTASETTTYRSR